MQIRVALSIKAILTEPTQSRQG